MTLSASDVGPVKDWKQTMCVLCYVNCGVEVLTEGRNITRVRGDKANKKSHGYVCQKAQRLTFYGNSTQRLTSPLKRRADGSGHDEISWEQALREIGDQLKAIHAEHGGEAFLFYGGGGQGNHLGGPYFRTLMNHMSAYKYVNALSQEKTGDFWVNGRLFGNQLCHTADQVDECDLLIALGCNPWLAHGFQDARNVVNEFKRDAERNLIVIDPRRTETADVADVHLQLNPGSDAFLLSAILSIILQRGAEATDFLAVRTSGFDEVRAVLLAVPVDEWIAASGVPRAEVERTVELILNAKRMVVRAELGIQQSRHSTLNSYLEKLLFLLTGNFGRAGTHGLHTWLQPLFVDSRGKTSSVTGQKIIGGYLPTNGFSDEVLTDHPNRVRAVWVDSNNPANTGADTQRFEEAMAALDLSVVVDVAYTETARLADYVLPAASQYEKWECTFFSFEIPTNYFHLRPPIFAPLAGTLPEAEIYTRLFQSMGVLPDDGERIRLTGLAATDRSAFLAEAMVMFRAKPELIALAPVLLYQTLGSTLPNGAAAAAPLWMACQRIARECAVQVQRALSSSAEGMDLANELFDTMLISPSGFAFTTHEWPETFDLIAHEDHRIHLAVPEMLEWLTKLDPADLARNPEFPMLASVGQRRSHNANQIMRDPGWRKTDHDGALWANPNDLDDLGITDGGWAVIETVRGSLVVRVEATDSFRPGFCALPHGYGQIHDDISGDIESGETGETVMTIDGPRINVITSHTDCDPIARTPYHKNVAVRLRPATSHEAATAEANALRIAALASRTPIGV
jgi:anaerobic selenocysteine-containing dehydrogenase